MTTNKGSAQLWIVLAIAAAMLVPVGLAAVVAGIGVVGIALDTRRHDTADERLARRVTRLLDRGKRDEARLLLERIASHAPATHQSLEEGRDGKLYVKAFNVEQFRKRAADLRAKGETRDLSGILDVYPWAYAMLAKMDLDAGHAESARIWIEAGLKLAPEEPYLSAWAARVYGKLGDPARAARAASTALESPYLDDASRAKLAQLVADAKPAPTDPAPSAGFVGARRAA
ncbi:MAG: hypothetical protein U0167_00165 [bacterium]